MVMAEGAAGAESKVFVSLTDLLAVFPHPEVNNTLTLSPALAAALLVYVTVITRELTFPESMLALAPNVPVNDQTYPVAAIVVVEAEVSAGAA